MYISKFDSTVYLSKFINLDATLYKKNIKLINKHTNNIVTYPVPIHLYTLDN